MTDTSDTMFIALPDGLKKLIDIGAVWKVGEDTPSLLGAIQQAERLMIAHTLLGQVGWLEDAYATLTCLACYVIAIVNRGEDSRVPHADIVQVEQLILAYGEYVPDKQFPFTKEQMLQAVIGGKH